MFVQTQFFNVYIHTFGNPNASPILLLHGFLGSGKDWADIAKHLAEKYYVLAPDIPGHGLTTHRHEDSSSFGDYSMENVAACFIDCLNAISIDKTYLCGYSMGGRLALYLALCYPKYFKAGCILSGTAGLRGEEERNKRVLHDEEIAHKLETMRLSDFLEFWYQQPIFATFRTHPHFTKATQSRINTHASEAVQSLRGMGTGSQPSVWDILSTNRIPITFAAGERDIKFVALAQEMHVCTPFSRIQIIPDAGHVLHIEAEKEIVELMTKIFA